MSNSNNKEGKEAEGKKPIVMKKYKYSDSSVRRFTGIDKKDYCLTEGCEVSLPATDNRVLRLVAKGKLKEVKIIKKS